MYKCNTKKNQDRSSLDFSQPSLARQGCIHKSICLGIWLPNCVSVSAWMNRKEKRPRAHKGKDGQWGQGLQGRDKPSSMNHDELDLPTLQLQLKSCYVCAEERGNFSAAIAKLHEYERQAWSRGVRIKSDSYAYRLPHHDSSPPSFPQVLNPKCKGKTVVQEVRSTCPDWL